MLWVGHTSKEQKVLGPGTQSCVLCAPVSGATPCGGVSPGILWKDDVESHGFREHSPLGFAPGRAALLTTALATVLVVQHLPRMQVLWFSGQHPAVRGASLARLYRAEGSFRAAPSCSHQRVASALTLCRTQSRGGGRFSCRLLRGAQEFIPRK